jgi:hypothetical protein
MVRMRSQSPQRTFLACEVSLSDGGWISLDPWVSVVSLRLLAARAINFPHNSCSQGLTTVGKFE